MSLIVQKFGGSSVRDYAHLLRMARIVKSRVDEGDDVVVVLSAQGDSTVFPLSHKSSVTSPPSLNTGKFRPIRFSGYSDSSFL